VDCRRWIDGSLRAWESGPRAEFGDAVPDDGGVARCGQTFWERTTLMSETEFRLNAQQKRTLLQLARAVVVNAVTGQRQPGPSDNGDAMLAQPCGAFVTLHVDGQLRGCIGTFVAREPLRQTIVEMAGAALDDPRFTDRRLHEAELSHLEIEISVLSPLTRTNDPLSLQLGTHGIYIRRGGRSGCFLPQVATETGWSKEDFLSYCCSHKAGLPGDAWKDRQTEVLLFTAEVFSETTESLLPDGFHKKDTRQ
jgi:AmmeMemoRadiSam system protein A